MALSPIAQRIWDVCEEYISLALKHLSLGGPYANASSITTFDPRPQQLRIQFLFPGINSSGGNALYNLRHEQWLHKSAYSDDRHQKTIASAHTAEQVEARFETQKREVQKFMFELSPIQQEIIREKFFKME